MMMPLLSPFLRIWDVVSSNRVDHFIANSRFVAKRIKKTYRRDAEVIFPPVKLEDFDIEAQPSLDYYVFISQRKPISAPISSSRPRIVSAGG